MKTRSRLHCFPAALRGGFTLMELMVVITIIGALMALAASAVAKYMGVQQESNTKTTLSKTQSQLTKAWSKVKDQALRAPMSEIVPGLGVTVEQWIMTNLAANVGNPTEPITNTTQRARVLYVKLRLRQAFPMTFNEALNPFPLPPLPSYMAYLTNLGIAGSTTPPAPYESSACLLMALQRGVSGAGIDPADLTSGGATGSITHSHGRESTVPNGCLEPTDFFHAHSRRQSGSQWHPCLSERRNKRRQRCARSARLSPSHRLGDVPGDRTANATGHIVHGADSTTVGWSELFVQASAHGRLRWTGQLGKTRDSIGI